MHQETEDDLRCVPFCELAADWWLWIFKQMKLGSNCKTTFEDMMLKQSSCFHVPAAPCGK